MEHFELLFAAKINIPKACEMVGMLQCEESWETMKQQFREWCEEQPLRFKFTNPNKN